MDCLEERPTTDSPDDSSFGDIRKILKSCHLDPGFVSYLSQTPAKLDSILTSLIQYYSYDDFEKTNDCFATISVLLENREAVLYLQNKFMLLYTTCKALFNPKSSKTLIQRAIRILYVMADCSKNLHYLLQNDVLEFLYKACRFYDAQTENSQNMLRLCLSFIEKLLIGQENVPEGDEISYRIADEHLILHQLNKDDEQIFGSALSILSLKKQVDFKVVKNCLETLEKRMDCDFSQRNLLILNFLTSVLKFPDSTRSVEYVIKFITSSQILNRCYPDFEQDSQICAFFGLANAYLLKVPKDVENLQFFRGVLVLTLHSGKLSDEAMILCLQSLILMELQFQKTSDDVSCKLDSIFSNDELEILIPALEIYQHNEKIIFYTCEAIFCALNLSNSDILRKFFMSKNADLLLLKTAQLHSESYYVLTAIFRAVRAFSDDSLLIGYEFTKYHNFEKWVQLFNKFTDNPRLCLEVILILDSWFQINSAIHDSVQFGVNDLVLKLIETFCSSSPKIVFYALNILSRYVRVFKHEGLNAAGLLAPTIKSLSVNLDDPEVQFKGLRLINSLALQIRNVEIKDDTLMTYCHLLTNNLSKHKDNLLIKKEVFLSLKIYSNTNLFFYQFVIDFKIIDKILHSLEFHEVNASTDAELEYLQRNFFLTLKKKCKLNILNEFLFLACDKNYAKSVVALILLGANANYEKNGQSCLSRLIANENLELLQFFLQRCNNKNIERCLSEVIKSKHYTNKDEIIATILSNYGVSEETGNIVWERLLLGNPKPEWLFRTFEIFQENPDEKLNQSKTSFMNGKSQIRKVNSFQEAVGPSRRKLTPAHLMSYDVPNYKSVVKRKLWESVLDMREPEETQTEPSPSRSSTDFHRSSAGLLKMPPSCQLDSKSSIADSDTSDLGTYHHYDYPVYPTFDEFLEVMRERSDSVNYFKFQMNNQSFSRPSSEGSLSFTTSLESSDALVDNFLEAARISKSANVIQEANLVVPVRNKPVMVGFARYHRFIVETMSISENNISSLTPISISPKLTHCFYSLKNFYLSKNKLSKLPKVLMENLPNLVTLSLSENSFTEFPVEVFLVEKLEDLDISHNFLTKMVPEQVCGLQSNVKALRLTGNQIKVWSDEFLEIFSQLAELQLDQNGISKLPEVSHLNNLQTLDLSMNNLSDIPEPFLSSLVNLKSLSLRNNKLSTLPGESAHKMTNLTYLDLTSNLIGSDEENGFPEFILNLPWLRDLNLSRNSLTSFPAAAKWRSKGLSKIRCSHNRISKIELGDDLSHFSQVTDLFFDNNDLRVIPTEICHLKKLEKLDVSHNPKIKRIPSDLYRCANLRQFNKAGLHLANMPNYVQRGDTMALMKYLHERAKTSSPYYSVKLLVMGQAGRGKTLLIRKLLEDTFDPDTQELQSNSGIEIFEWNLPALDRKLKKQVAFTINCWDFNGQEDCYATHQVFASKDALYMVVYNFAANDIQEELNITSSWLYNIHARGPNSPTIIVGTHVDLMEDQSEVAQRKNICMEFLRNNFFSHTHRYTYAFVGCKNRSETLDESFSVAELRSLIRTKLAEYKAEGEYFMGRKVPVVYQNLEKAVKRYKEKVQRNKTGVKSVIDSHTVANLIKSEKLDIQQHDIYLAMKFLNSTGTVLTFSNMLPTRSNADIYFLDPQWLCSLMTRIISPNPKWDSIIHNGVITYEGLCIIYAQEITLLKIYCSLLEKFCILIPIEEKRWLISSRLPQKPSSFVSRMLALRNSYVIQRIYSMLFLPPSMMALYLARIISELQNILPETSRSKGGKNNHTTIDYFSNYFEITVLKEPAVVATIEVRKAHQTSIVITVPKNADGRKILGNLIDHFDMVISEWYYGLSPEFENPNTTLFETHAVCYLCIRDQKSDPNVKPTLFSLQQLAVLLNQKTYEVVCSQHPEEPLSLFDLAPDLTFSDLSSECPHLSIEQFESSRNPVSRLGSGGFGTVFRTSLNEKDVAVKVFSDSEGGEGGEQLIRTLSNLRKELKVMVRLRHPSILSALGFTLAPQASLVLELAPHGSLSGVMSSGLIKGRLLKAKILRQVAEGLSVLHRCKIIYRDLKPDNVLIFSLNPEAAINAKIADYGIACHIGSLHLSSPAGTVGYRAPEQIRGRYSMQSDIYAFGILAYFVATNGAHPLGDIQFSDAVEKAVLSNVPFPSICERGAAPWPDMETMILECTASKESKRPQASDIVKLFLSYDFQLMRRNEKLPIELPESYVVNCVTGSRCKNDTLRLLVGTGSDKDNKSHIVSIEYSNATTNHRAVALPEKEIMSIKILDDSLILVGTLHGALYKVLLSEKPEFSKLLQFSGDTILCISSCTLEDDTALSLIGLASGTVVCVETSILTSNKNLTSYDDNSNNMLMVKLGTDFQAEFPICNLINVGRNKVWLSCGSQLMFYEVVLQRRSTEHRETMDLTSQPNDSRESPSLGREMFCSVFDEKQAPVNKLLVHEDHVIVSRIRNPILETYLWISSSYQLRPISKVDLSSPRIFQSVEPCPKPQGLYIRDLSIVASHTLWVALKSGHIVAFNLHHIDYIDILRVIKRHDFDTQLLFSSEESIASCDSEFIPLVFSIGKGFVSNALAHSTAGESGQTEDLRLKPWNLIAWKAAEVV